MQLNDIQVRLVTILEKDRFHELMQIHHYLGSTRPVGETLHYVATLHDEWIALLSFSSAAFYRYARDGYKPIGWSDLIIRYFFWKPLLIHSGFTVRFTKQPTGSAWVAPRGFVEPIAPEAIATRVITRPSSSLRTPCSATHYGCCRSHFSIQPINAEHLT